MKYRRADLYRCIAETLESRRLLSGGGSSEFDSIAEATDLGAALGVRYADGDLASSDDVDVFRIELASGQTIDAYLALEEPPAGPVDGLVRLHDATGVVVATGSDALHPTGDLVNTELTFTAPSAGSYYLSVAAAGNNTFDLTTGDGDTAGTTPGGSVAAGEYRVLVFAGAGIPATAGNGHYYGLTNYGTWSDAQAEAVAAGGQLLAIDSAAEQDFIQQTFLSPNVATPIGGDNPNIFWTGLNDAAVEGAFAWTANAPVAYTNWEPTEPNDQQDVGGEDHGVLNWHWAQWRSNAGYTTSPIPGSWNDVPNTGNNLTGTDQASAAENYRGIIEFETLPTGFAGPLFQWTGTSPNAVPALRYVNGGALNPGETPRVGNGTHFGSIAVGETGHLRRYVIDNASNDAAIARNLVLPDGFVAFDNNANALAGEGLVIPTGGVLGFTLQMQSDALGVATGTVAFEVIVGENTFAQVADTAAFDIAARVVEHQTTQLIGNILYVHGTPDGDNIEVEPRADFDTVTSRLDGDTFGIKDLADIGRIEVYTYGGDDIVTRPGVGIPTYVFGGDGDDSLIGGSGIDTLSGGAGKNTLRGGNGDDRINGSNGRDFLFGDDGDDRLYGRGGNDDLHGGAGVDRLFGDEEGGPYGDDKLYGGSSNDKLYGRSGNDQLFGQGQDDLLDAGPGDDLLNGGTDADTLFGGSGNDTAATDAADLIDGVESIE